MTVGWIKNAPPLLAVAVAFICFDKPAQANGAFPDSMGILLPADQPNRIIASTNFGLLVSEDAGATWGWICEQAVGLNTLLYQQGVPPNDLLLAVSTDGVTYSGDFGCTWNRSGGSISGSTVYDAFPNAVAPLDAYALAQRTSNQSAVESRDGFQTFGPDLFTSSGNQFLSGIENARSRPQTLYITIYNLSSPSHTSIARSYNGGATWQPLFNAGPQFDGVIIRGLIGVDPVNERRVYLRLLNNVTGREFFGIYDDDPVQGSGTLRVALDIPARISAFLRRSDGALIVASSNGASFISTDQGATFASWPNAPHFRALGERNGILYAVADNYVDGFAVGRSLNQGATWEGLFRFEQIRGPKNCGNLATRCAAPWETLKGILGIGGVDGGTDLDGGSGATPRRSSCSSVADLEVFGPAGCLAIAMLWLRRRSRRGLKES